MKRGRHGVVAGAMIACVAAALAGLGAARLPSATPAALCIPIILPCDSPSPTPTPSPTSISIVPVLPALPGVPSPSPTPGAPVVGTPTPTPTPTTTPAGPDDGAPVFTQPPAQLGSRSLSFTGLKGISVVTVPLADGSRIPVLKISADGITIDGFSLTVRKSTGPVLATTADRMALTGNVQVYLDSATATGSDGKSLTLGADTPPPQDGLPPQLLKVTLGLVGVTADSIHFTNPHQHLSE